MAILTRQAMMAREMISNSLQKKAIERDYITAIDKTTAPDDGFNRQVSLGIYEDGLHLLGGLSHNTVIGFDKDNAKKLVAYLKKTYKL